MVKQFLSQNRVRYEEKDVSRNRAFAEELVKNTGQMGVPVTVFDGEVVVGFNKPKLEELVDKMKARERATEKAREDSKPPSFGAAIADAEKILKSKGMDSTPGAYIGRVRDGSLADRMGFIPGDVITEANSGNISGSTDLEGLLARLKKGDRLSMVYRRGNRTMTAEGVY